MDYETLRQFADTWGLLFLLLVFVGLVGWVYRRGAKKHYEEQGKIPLKRD